MLFKVPPSFKYQLNTNLLKLLGLSKVSKKKLNGVD